MAQWARDFNDHVFYAFNNLNTDYVFNFAHNAPLVGALLN